MNRIDRAKQQALLNITHGMTKTKVYGAWRAMRQRCLSPSSVSYPNYGGRGIKICRRWEKFENFYADMGDPPSPKHSLDRKKTNGNYTPSNCRWATKKEQDTNRRSNVRFKHKGKMMTVSELTELSGLKYGTLYRRLVLSGWTVERAIQTKPRHPVFLGFRDVRDL